MQPIDLQNMYSQLSNVAKTVAGQQQAAQLSDSIQQQQNVQKNIENAQKIQKINEQPDAKTINPDGRNGSWAGSQKQKNKEHDNSEGQSQIQSSASIQPEYLGTIIDITR